MQVMSAAWHESVLEHKIQDSKNRLFFCCHQAQGFSTASVHPRQAYCEARATWLDVGAPMRYAQRCLMKAFMSNKLPADLRTQRRHLHQKGGYTMNKRDRVPTGVSHEH